MLNRFLGQKHKERRVSPAEPGICTAAADGPDGMNRNAPTAASESQLPPELNREVPYTATAESCRPWYGQNAA
ncbi:hypothetical protein J8L08_09770 [Bacteroides fragilis]|uniref:hypothetical protein n=1 Tax=Bacteroides fragilis TaxID=817 RepID=UPI00202F37CC|nr:hypothetical protein [Bacteroides fragilis]MCM0275914.1 hypothetical protein [Bacteroides fragilis]